MHELVTRVEKSCRSCGARSLASVLNLGSTPLANKLVKPEDVEESEERFGLELALCDRCALVQLTESVPPERLFGEYPYFSSFSDTMLRHAESIVARTIDKWSLGPSSLAVEVASNDGYLLQYYKRAGIPVLGIEPAANIARVAERERGIPTVCEFFGADLGDRLARENRRADVIHANNVLAHVPDLNGFVRGIATLLRDSGVAILEVPYVRDMIDHLEFDTIYHEHLFYFSLTAIHQLFARHGLIVADVERLAIHGGSLRIFAEKATKASVPSNSVRSLLEDERAGGIDDVAYFRDFGARVEQLKRTLTGLLSSLKASGKRLAAYGASAKGSTLLNTFGIGKETLDFVVDRSGYKQGWCTPGTHLPIRAPEHLLEAMPDYVVLLSWNFEAEILAQQKEYRRRGGQFIVPIPDVRIV
jgi:SAM-dependent methyltransferase